MATTMDYHIPPPASPGASPTAATPAALPSPDPPPASPDASNNAATPAALPSPKLSPAPSARPAPPILRDPSLLPHSEFLAAYIDVFVDDFIAICQGSQNRRQVRQLLLQAVDQVFCPNDFHDNQSAASQYPSKSSSKVMYPGIPSRLY